MTFDQIVGEVMERLNLTSQDARDRVGMRVNSRYRRLTSSIGLITSRRVMQDLDVDPSDVDSTLPDITVEGIEKVMRIVVPLDSNRVRRLDQLTYDDLTERATGTSVTRAWAPKRMGAGQVIITIDTFPTTPFTLRIEGYELTDTLADDAEPAIPSDYHEILVEGVIADELRKMEKAPLAQIADAKYEQLLNDLRMFINKSAYLDIIQGTRQAPWWQRIPN